MDILLHKNGWEIVASEEEAYSMVMELADGKITETQLAQWLKKHTSKLDR
jgi:death-on-curing protein